MEERRKNICVERNSADTDGRKENYKKIFTLLTLLKLNKNLAKWIFTPHVVTEICSHINIEYNADSDFERIVNKTASYIDLATEGQLNKKEFIGSIAYSGGMKLEPGDLSIYAIADRVAAWKEKIAILTKDYGFTNRYYKNDCVLIIDYTQLSDLPDI